MTSTETSSPSSAATKRVPWLIAGTVVILLVVFIGGLLMALQQALQSKAAAASLRRQATQLAIDRGITLCRAGQVPSGLLWLGRSLEMAPPGDADLQRLIRTNISAWSDRSYAAIDVLMHGASVQAIACSSDGNTLATAGADGRVVIWKLPIDVKTPGTQISFFSVGDPPTSWAFDSAGKTLVTGSDDGTIRFFDVTTGKQQKLVINQAGSVSSAAISPDGTFLVTGSAAGILRRWDLKTGKMLSESAGHTDWVLSIAISPDDRYFLSGGNDNKARLWRTDTGKPVGVPIDLQSAVSGVSFSADGTQFLTTAGYNATLFRTIDQQPDGDPIRHDAAIRSASFNSSGTSIVTSCRDGFIRTWDTRTRAAIAPAIRCVTSVRLAKFAPDGQTIISADDVQGVRIWRLPGGDRPILSIYTGLAVTALAFTPDGKRVVVGTSAAGDPGLPSDEGWGRIYRTDDGQPDSPPFASGAGVISAVVSDDGKLLLTGSSSNFVRLRSLPDLSPIGDPLYYGNRLRSVALIADQKMILASGADAGGQGDVKIWKYNSAPSSGVFPTIIDQDQAVVSVSVSPDKKQIATAAGTGEAKVWTVTDAQPTGAGLLHWAGATVALFRPDGNAVLSADQNGTARLWDSHTGGSLSPAMQNAGPVACGAITLDGNIAALSTVTPTMKWFGGWGRGTSTVQLWDAHFGIAIGDSFHYPTWAIWRVAISPDGTVLAVGSADGFVRFYKLPVPDRSPAQTVLAKLQLMLNRQMDENQTELPLFAADWLARRKVMIAPPVMRPPRY